MSRTKTGFVPIGCKTCGTFLGAVNPRKPGEYSFKCPDCKKNNEVVVTVEANK